MVMNPHSFVLLKLRPEVARGELVVMVLRDVPYFVGDYYSDLQYCLH